MGGDGRWQVASHKLDYGKEYFTLIEKFANFSMAPNRMPQPALPDGPPAGLKKTITLLSILILPLKSGL